MIADGVYCDLQQHQWSRDRTRRAKRIGLVEAIAGRGYCSVSLSVLTGPFASRQSCALAGGWSRENFEPSDRKPRAVMEAAGRGLCGPLVSPLSLTDVSDMRCPVEKTTRHSR